MSASGEQSNRTAPSWQRALQRIVWAEPLWVMSLGVLLLLPQRFLPEAIQAQTALWRASGLVVLIFGGLLRWLAYGRLTRRTPLDWPLAFMLLWLPVNYWAAVNKPAAWEALSPLIIGVAMYLALLNWPPAHKRPQLIAGLILLFGVGLAFTTPLFSDLAIGKVFRIPALESAQQRLSEALPGNVNTNQIGGVLAVVIPLAAALALRRDWSTRRWPSLLAALATLFMLAMLALTQSRGAYLAAAVALAIVVLLRWPKLRYAIPFVLLALAVAVVIIGPPQVIELALSGSAVSGAEGRVEIWSRALYAISDFPFTGIGIGTWNEVIPTLYPLFSVAPDAKLNHAHNLLLQVSLDLGLPGLIAYLALYANTSVLLIITLRRRAAAVNWTLAAGTAGALTAMFLHGIVDVPLWDSKPAFLPWLFMALAMLIGLQTVIRSRGESEQP
jgi:putative inorganic carbon (HCO3(-)) transporter